MVTQVATRSVDGKHVAFYRGPRERTWKSVSGVSVTIDDVAMQIALHEAGHAVVALALEMPVYMVDIFPDECRGTCHHTAPKCRESPPSREPNFDGLLKIMAKYEPDNAALNSLHPNLVVLAAGIAAQRLYNPGAGDHWANRDYENMERYAKLIAHGRHEIVEELISTHKKKAAEMVEQHRDAICAVAAELYHAHVLMGDEVREIARLNH